MEKWANWEEKTLDLNGNSFVKIKIKNNFQLLTAGNLWIPKVVHVFKEQAVKTGDPTKITKRVARRAVGKQTGRALGKLFK